MNSSILISSGAQFLRGLKLRALAALALLCGKSTAEPAVNYFDDIRPLLSVRCGNCHGGESQKSGLRLDSAATAMKGGKSGLPAFVPGDSVRSEIIRRITSRDPDEQMPPKGARLSDSEVSRIRRWI